MEPLRVPYGRGVEGAPWGVARHGEGAVRRSGTPEWGLGGVEGSSACRVAYPWRAGVEGRGNSLGFASRLSPAPAYGLCRGAEADGVGVASPASPHNPCGPIVTGPISCALRAPVAAVGLGLDGRRHEPLGREGWGEREERGGCMGNVAKSRGCRESPGARNGGEC
jgi:hypothetical protein